MVSVYEEKTEFIFKVASKEIIYKRKKLKILGVLRRNITVCQNPTASLNQNQTTSA